MATMMGGSFVASVISAEVYDPVYDTPMDAKFIYQLLPSYYRTEMQDQELFSTVWSGALQNAAADLLNLWQIDYAKSLRDVPVLAQRKWVQFDLYREEDFEVDPVLETAGLTSLFSYDAVEKDLQGTAVSRARWDKAYIDLKGAVDERTSLAWSVDLNLSSVDTYGAVLFGYFGSARKRLSNTLAVAVIGDTGGSALADTPSAAILHLDPNSGIAVSLDSYVLTLGLDYRFDTTYTAGTGAVVLSVVELRKEKLTGTSGSVPEEVGSAFTNTFTDLTRNFFTDGAVEGDILVVLGSEYEITSVDGSTLTVMPIGLSVDLSALTYQILGEVEVSSLSMDLPGDAADPTFVADQFGISSFDTRSNSTILFAPASAARKRRVTVTTDSWRYLDPTVGEVIQSLPRLQDVITDPQDLLFEGTDYSVEVTSQIRLSGLTNIAGGTIVPGLRVEGVGSGAVAVVLDIDGSVALVSPRAGSFVDGEPLEFTGGITATLGFASDVGATSTIKFQEPPLLPWWAEYVAYDELYIRDNFGLNVGLDGLSSDQYKARVRGLYYAYFQGPTVEAIRIGVHILIGLPIAEKAGTVESINPAYSGTLGLLTVEGRDYLYPLLVGTDLLVGDVVELFQPLTNGVEVIDYLIDPEWFLSFSSLEEIQKFHSFQVALDLDAFSLDTLDLAGQFVQQIKPTWKQKFFLVFKNLIDEVTMSDAVILALSLNLADTFCDTFVVTYDGVDYEGEEADWKYDQGVADWDATSAAMRATSTELVGTAALVNASAAAVGTTTAWLTDLVGPGDEFVSAALYTTGSTGETTSGSFYFLDNTPNAFDALLVSDHIDITGESIREIHSIDRNTFSTGVGEFDGTTTFRDATALWLTSGVQVGDLLTLTGGLNDGLEFAVLSVGSETELTISSAATDTTIDTGTGDFIGLTLLEDAGATFVSTGVLPGDIVIITGGGVNNGLEFTVALVTSETRITTAEIATISVGETYRIERRESYVVERVNQLRIDAPLASTASAVAWSVTGEQAIWGQVASVADDLNLTFSTIFGGLTGTYKLALLDNAYKEVFYDQFEEACPDEAFTIELLWTDGGGAFPAEGAKPGYVVPAADPTATTTHTFDTGTETYTVTLTEPTP